MRIRLKELRQEKAAREGLVSLSQEVVSEETGIPQGTLSRWEGDKVDRLDKNVIGRLCEYFDCEVGDLLALERDSA